MKRGKRHMAEGMELPIQEKNRTPGERETYKYLTVLEAETIKQVEMKEKIRKNTSREQESYTKPN